ncbi:MAG: CHAT domain-containing protein [Bacteroidia bacterium]|nr:CHAT domain-containing protein [Bacteroidia bacterium]
MPDIQALRQLIAQNRLDDVLKQLKPLPEAKDFENEIIMLESDLNGFNRSERTGLLTTSEAGLQRRQLTSRLLNLLGEIERASGSAVPPVKPPDPAQQFILFIGAAPADLPPIDIDQEIREIEEGLRRARLRERFQLEQRQAARAADLRRALLDLERSPRFIHFAGYGHDGSDGRPAGLIFEDEQGKSRIISGAALTGLFSAIRDVECVLLNAALSIGPAQELAREIPYVIGMDGKLLDRAAIVFAIGFYDAIGSGRSIEDAFRIAKSSIELEGLPADQANIPQLLKKA